MPHAEPYLQSNTCHFFYWSYRFTVNSKNLGDSLVTFVPNSPMWPDFSSYTGEEVTKKKTVSCICTSCLT